MNRENLLPAFFLGHGSPMNALENNAFTAAWRSLGKEIHGIRAVLVVSAHWLTHGTHITAMEKPQTIHDFGGFPQELFAAEYPAPGSGTVAEEICDLLAPVTKVQKNYNWGLDHGTWSVLMHMFPAATVPVLQLSIDADTPAENYFRIGETLRTLRDKGILIVGSGNIVHNLQLVDWRRLNAADYAFDWAREADALATQLIREKKWDDLIHFEKLPQSMQTAINSAEHFVPLLYVLGAALPEEEPVFFNQVAVGGALTMTSVRFG